jgi:hypothetical protein
VGPVWFQKIFVEYSLLSHLSVAVMGEPLLFTRRALPDFLSMQE